MAWTQTDVSNLEALIASGAKTVKYADKGIECHDLDSMLKLLNTMRAELGIATPNRNNVSRMAVASFSKGFN